MKVKIIRESLSRPWAWYNEVKPFKHPTTGKMLSGVKNKVGQIYEVSDEGDCYKTVDKVFGGRTRGLIDKEDCVIV